MTLSDPQATPFSSFCTAFHIFVTIQIWYTSWLEQVPACRWKIVPETECGQDHVTNLEFFTQ